MENIENITRYTFSGALELLADKHGERFREYRRMWDDATNNHIVPEYPLYIALNINSDCNLRCKMCIRAYDNAANDKHQNMPLELVDIIVKQCRDFHCPSILIGSDSECLLHPEVDEVVKRIKSFDPVDFIMITNGTLLDKKKAELIISEEIDRLHISVDASSEETYKKIRGGNLKVLERNIENFIEMRDQSGKKTPIVRLSFCKQPDNKGEEESFVEKWRNKVDLIDFQNLLDISNYFAMKEETEISNVHFHCPQPYQRLLVDYHGDIYACCDLGFYKYWKLGNLRTMTLMEAWNSDKLKELRRSFETQRINKVCLNCMASRNAAD